MKILRLAMGITALILFSLGLLHSFGFNVLGLSDKAFHLILPIGFFLIIVASILRQYKGGK